MNILVINSGSSSLKYQLIETKTQTVTKTGTFERIGIPGGEFGNHGEAIKKLFADLGDTASIAAIGHRVVHGGELFKQSTVATAEVLRELEKISHLAPLHNPANILGVRECMKLLPKIPNVMVFDTAFHSDMPKSAFLYALPIEDYNKHKIRRYGFHGTSHNYVSRECAKIMGKPREKLRIITCHIGNGCSIAAVDKGRSVETSMGLTPLEGLVMGSRSGDIDPAVIGVLCKMHDFSTEQCISYLNSKSGLLGLCGASDMRDLHARNDDATKCAMDVFVHRIVKYIGAYMAVMGGADAIVWTGGIGNNDGKIRELVMANFEFAGVKIDFAKNKKLCGGFQTGEISAEGAKVRTFVIKTNEELEIAFETERVTKNN